ncbi:hypothetical protein [Actinocatenispora comari]|uniref:Uncharacterized protein n=1 Tax=Actinocatenispora comari TaxID=2807577 RepID=A0A8J4AHQ9_9ACTN|nr:hypothetical protein [Actinocatenispora comari]GIL29937.1 hypothetical protein NUM_51910 [Actinocatenispora comari]
MVTLLTDVIAAEQRYLDARKAGDRATIRAAEDELRTTQRLFGAGADRQAAPGAAGQENR